MNRHTLRLALLLLITPLLGACFIASHPSVDLHVPYRAQAAGSLDCGPASVLMWRLYDGLPEISQQTIGAWMGGTCSGVSQQALANAVGYFTNTFDAYWDFVGDDEIPSFMSRQITSIDSRIPVIAIISFNHAGVVNGGKWHDAGGGFNEWDFVYFHDPSVRANDYYSGGLWIDSNCPVGSPCEQIISYGASAAWAAHLAQFQSSVIVGGALPGCNPNFQGITAPPTNLRCRY
jgi:Peptidase_C39 like family